MIKAFLCSIIMLSALTSGAQMKRTPSRQHPNVIYICADDLGYGDLSCYGATKIHTPNLDRLAASGIRFTNAHSTSSTCTPSRYAFMTGLYPWRKQGTGVLSGDASLIVPTDRITLPKVFKRAGYTTAIIGKWHLGLGKTIAKDWNGEITPGPNETGYNFSFIFPATADRVPTVFLENHRVIAAEKDDPITVNYDSKVGTEPTGREHPELLKLHASAGHGHDGTIVNGIGRIGFMAGGKLARWVDEEVSATFLAQAQSYILNNQKKPFFLYFATTEPHVPRMPATRFRGKSGLGLRGDAILQLDWTIGELMKTLKTSGLDKNTIIIFSSDNGPVLDDGYEDEAVAKLNGHRPTGPMRGGKYSILEGGTRVPFIVSWPVNVKPMVSDALVSQIDLLASFAFYFKQSVPSATESDSKNLFNTLTGKSRIGRSVYIEQGTGLAIIKDGWKYISPNNGVSYAKLTGIETGNSKEPQLYNLKEDIGEMNNLASKYPNKVKELAELLKATQTAIE